MFVGTQQSTPKTIREHSGLSRQYLNVVLGQMVKMGVLERNQRFDAGCKYTFYKITYKGGLLLESHGYPNPKLRPELKEFLEINFGKGF